MSRWIVLIASTLLGATLALPAAAQWKWKDGKGQVQYSDLPPPAGVTERDILQRPNGAVSLRAAAAVAQAASAPASAASGLAPKTVEPELEAKRKKEEQEAAAKKAAEDQRIAAAKADNCNRAKAQVRSLDSGLRMARTNDKGEREIMDDKMRAEEMKRARDVASSDCK
jgi:hypothetical protein